MTSHFPHGRIRFLGVSARPAHLGASAASTPTSNPTRGMDGNSNELLTCSTGPAYGVITPDPDRAFRPAPEHSVSPA